MVNAKVKVMLARRNMTARELADKIGDGCSPAIVSYICNGKVMPSRELLRAMCWNVELETCLMTTTSTFFLGMMDIRETARKRSKPN